MIHRRDRGGRRDWKETSTLARHFSLALRLVKIKHSPRDTIGQDPDVEIDDQSDFPSTKAKIRHQLRLVNRQDLVHGFELKQQTPVNE